MCRRRHELVRPSACVTKLTSVATECAQGDLHGAVFGNGAAGSDRRSPDRCRCVCGCLAAQSAMLALRPRWAVCAGGAQRGGLPDLRQFGALAAPWPESARSRHKPVREWRDRRTLRCLAGGGAPIASGHRAAFRGRPAAGRRVPMCDRLGRWPAGVGPGGDALRGDCRHAKGGCHRVSDWPPRAGRSPLAAQIDRSSSWLSATVCRSVTVSNTNFGAALTRSGCLLNPVRLPASPSGAAAIVRCASWG
jgi:hypothetical protein